MNASERTSLKGKDARKARERERKRSLQKGKDKYNIVKGLAEMADGISFESLHKKKHYLRARDGYLILEPYDDSDDYRKQTTFLPLQDMWHEGFFAFESLLNPAHFIRRRDEQLILHRYENSTSFKEDASFKLSKKRCIACVRIGCRVWAREEKNCFARGIVTAINDYIYVKLENGKKIHHRRDSPESFAADIVPHITEVGLGTRVLGKWYNRRTTFYSGTVTAVNGHFFEVQYDDGDKSCNQLTELRLLKRPEIQRSDAPPAPSWSSIDALPRIGGTGLCIEYDDYEDPIARPRTVSQGTSSGPAQESDSLSPRDSPIDRIESPSENVGPGIHICCEHLSEVEHEAEHETEHEHEHEHEREHVHAHVHANGHAHAHDHGDTFFGYENNFHYLSPNHCHRRSSMERNVSQVSGSSSDSGYHGGSKMDKEKRAALCSIQHCKSNQNVSRCATYDSRFLSPLTNVLPLHLHVPEEFNVERNLSELSVTSSDSGYQVCGKAERSRDPTRPPFQGPGRAVQICQEDEQHKWTKRLNGSVGIARPEGRERALSGVETTI